MPDDNNEPDLDTRIHQAVAGHVKGLKQSLMTELKTGIPEMIAPTLAETIKAQLAEFQKTFKPATGDDGGANARGSDAGGGDKPTPQQLALQSRLEAMEQNFKNSQEALARANDQAWEKDVYQRTQSHFKDKVRPEFIEDITDRVIKIKGLVKKHTDGSPVFLSRKPLFTGGPEEERNLPLEDGLNEYLLSKDAARYLPPPSPARGRGQSATARTGAADVAQPPQFSGEPKTSREKIQRAMARERFFEQQAEKT